MTHINETTVRESDIPHESEIARRLAEAGYYNAEAEKFRAETREAIAKADAQELYLRGEQRKEKLALIADHYVHHHFFNGPVDDRSVFACLNQLAAWDRVDPECDMNITIDSPGGSVVDGFHLLDQLTTYSLRGGGRHKVTMTVRGYAASMAGILLQAADERVIGPHAYVLIHQVSSWAEGSMGALKDKVKWLDLMSEQVVNLFLERSQGKISREKFESSWDRSDWWVRADQCLEYGFADRIG